jgi:hypothetical protein
MRKYLTPEAARIEKLNTLRRLRAWSNDQAGIALALGDTAKFMRLYRRVNQFQLAIFKLEKESR